MVSRRTRYEPLQTTTELRWLVIRTMVRQLQHSECLPAGSDLKAALVRTLAAHAADGWQLESFSSSFAVAFCNRDAERRMIGIECLDPTTNP
jgi:hypothetical protein